MYKNRNRVTGFVQGPKLDPRVIAYVKGSYQRNEHGFLMNDFAQLMAAEDDYHMALALSRLREYQQQNPNAGKSFEEIVKEIKPRYVQSPAEMDRFEQYCIDNALELYRSLKEKTDEDTKQAVAEAMASQESKAE